MNPHRAALIGLTALAFVLGLVRYEGPTEGYWDTYIAAPAIFMTGQGIDFELKDGTPAWSVSLDGVLPDDLVDEDSYGIITKDQRIGAPMVAAPFFLAFGLFGFHLLYALGNALLVPAGVLACRAALPRHEPDTPQAGRCAALFGAVALAFNPYILSVDRLNANLLILPACLVLLHLLTRHDTPWAAAGLVFGVIAGIRNEAICFVPAITFWVLSGGGDERVRFPERIKRLVTVGACCVVAMLPIFFWKAWAFGHPLMHPSQYPHFQGFRPEFEHSLFGATFSFNGLFNWPLHDTLVRTPHFAFPTWLLFPLVTLRTWGLIGGALLVLGVGFLWRRGRRALTTTLVLWMLPVYVLFGPQENWEEVKMTFMLLAWPPLALLAAAAVDALWRGRKDRRLWAVLAATTLVLGGFVKLCGTVEAPADERWYVRFPNAALATNPDAQAGLTEDERNDWRYFQSYETDEEVAREREKLTAAYPWPARYLPVSWSVPDAVARIARESGEHELTVLEIWGYIYGSRR
jgi:hypothetical protein